MYAIVQIVGMLLVCSMAAFEFGLFKFPGKDVLFLLALSALMVPGVVTLIPTYRIVAGLHWLNSIQGLAVPGIASAFGLFLLRQFMMTLPRELDEAAVIDGASPLRVLWSVIIPQSYAAIVAVSIFHIVWAWNDYFNPLLYLSSRQDLQPISIALARFNYMYGSDPQYIQAGALMTILIPVIVFFAAQRFFVQGIVITGVEK